MNPALFQEPLPDDIRAALSGFDFSRDQMGLSKAEVICCWKGEARCFLKIEAVGEESLRERQMLHWLQGRLPVPRILAEAEQSGRQYLLLSALPGEMACAPARLAQPEQTARLLARGLKQLWNLDSSDCPSVRCLEQKLASARRRVQSGEVQLEPDWQHDFLHTPEQILQYLEQNRPEEAQVVFSHGDYCLPNLFLQGTAVSGFLDLGRAGMADIWQDIALCVRSLRYNFEDISAGQARIDAFFEELGVQPDARKIEYYILLDEIF